MNSKEFQSAAVQMAQLIADYRDNIADFPVLPNVKPGFLPQQIPNLPPYKPESWNAIKKDLNNIIIPGMTHWQHPQFFAYFPASASYPGILAEMIAGALSSNSTSWTACPAATELEMNMMDWLGRAMGLPKHFIFSEPGSTGGGVQTTSASESVLCAMLAARRQALKYLKTQDESVEYDSVLLPRLVMYSSCEAHSCVEKAAMIGLVRLRILDVDEKSAMRGGTLKKAIEKDIAAGLHPFFVVCTLGTTSTTSCDNLQEIGPIVKDLPACWLHLDGAYGACSMICPELRGPMNGIEYVDSIDINPNKWLLINAESSGLFVKDKTKLKSSLVADAGLHGSSSEMEIPHEYRHWGIQLGRRFRSLKVWMTFKTFGLERLQRQIRNHCALAKLFEGYVTADPRFQVLNEVKMGLVCFRLRGDNRLTKKLLETLNSSRKLHMSPTKIQDKYSIRLALVNEFASKDHIDAAWMAIQETATEVLDTIEGTPENLEINSMLAFVQEVKPEMLNRRRGSLKDFAQLIDVLPRDIDGNKNANEEQTNAASRQDTDETGSLKDFGMVIKMPEVINDDYEENENASNREEKPSITDQIMAALHLS